MHPVVYKVIIPVCLPCSRYIFLSAGRLLPGNEEVRAGPRGLQQCVQHLEADPAVQSPPSDQVEGHHRRHPGSGQRQGETKTRSIKKLKFIKIRIFSVNDNPPCNPPPPPPPHSKHESFKQDPPRYQR